MDLCFDALRGFNKGVLNPARFPDIFLGKNCHMCTHHSLYVYLQANVFCCYFVKNKINSTKRYYGGHERGVALWVAVVVAVGETTLFLQAIAMVMNSMLSHDSVGMQGALAGIENSISSMREAFKLMHSKLRSDLPCPHKLNEPHFP